MGWKDMETDRLIVGKWGAPIVQRCCEFGIHPNMVTLGNVMLVPFIIQAYLHGQHNRVMALFVARFYLDCLDGEVARGCKKTSKLGAVLDTMTDSVHQVLLIWLFADMLFGRVVAFKATVVFLVLTCLFWLRHAELAMDHTLFKGTNNESLLKNVNAVLINNSMITGLPLLLFCYYQLTRRT